MRINKRVLAGLLIGTVTITAGCSGNKKTDVIEAETESATGSIVQTERQTQLQTQVQTEPQTERRLSLKDVQVKVSHGSKTGMVSYSITVPSGVETGQMKFDASTSALRAEEGEKGVFGGDQFTAYKQDGNWKKLDMTYADLWSSLYSSDCRMLDRSDVDGKNCYHLTADNEDVAGILAAICGTEGYENTITGEAKLDYYIDPDTFDVIRTDVDVPFQAEKGDGFVQGYLFATFQSKLAESVNITAPKTTTETKAEDIDRYEPGIISTSSNAYQNRFFDIQLLGKDSFLFDQSRTDAIASDYENAKSSYKEEAYAEGASGILNLVSINTDGKTKDEVLEKYMTDSSAVAIQTAGLVDVGASSYVCSTATINGTKTKTYCTEENGRALLITVYFSDDTVPSELEANMYGFDENPFWEEESWILDGKIDVTTPKGYSIVKSESADLYVCMRSNADDVNIFAIDGRDISSEAEKETLSSGDLVREVIIDEQVMLPTGEDMRYLSVHNTDSNYDYYTYVGLVQKGETVIKYYVVSVIGDADYREVFTQFANYTEMHQETSSNEGEDQQNNENSENG